MRGGMSHESATSSGKLAESIFFRTDKPYVRWWWFNERIDANDIARQVKWIAEQGFGGVEIAWVYPLPGRASGPAWLSPEWTALVVSAKAACSALALGCDFTFGSLWPFGDSGLSGSQRSQWYTGPSPQRIDRHWESRDVPGGPPVLNHLDKRAFQAYAGRTAAALSPALSGDASCLFCDSWEVEEEGKLWTDGFGERFHDRFGYRIEPFLPDLDEHPPERYDYRLLVSQMVLQEFYRPYADLCRSVGALSRIQCHGAPTDIVAAYAEADIPESESLLFDPEFSRFAASAAAITGKNIVSCESFTCLYGWNPWPSAGPHLGEEKIGDLKLLADALAAHGVNRFIWHGMPFNGTGGRNRFYASVHVGPDGSLASRMGELNRYLERISEFLREGRPAHRVACLAPLEDVRMKGLLPEDLRKPSARFWWELQHPCLPRALRPWSPLWVTGAFLDAVEIMAEGALRFGSVTVMALIVDSDFLDSAVLEQLARLAARGGRLILTKRPREPGRQGSRDYHSLVEALDRGPRTTFARDPRAALRDVPPVLECETELDFFIRERDGEHNLFIAHPAVRSISYPMEFDQAARADAVTCAARFRGSLGADIDLPLPFEVAGSILFRIGRSGARERVTAGFAVEK
jgi:hypothetical protein